MYNNNHVSNRLNFNIYKKQFSYHIKDKILIKKIQRQNKINKFDKDRIHIPDFSHASFPSLPHLLVLFPLLQWFSIFSLYLFMAPPLNSFHAFQLQASLSFFTESTIFPCWFYWANVSCILSIIYASLKTASW